MMDTPCTRQELGFPLPANQPSDAQVAEVVRREAVHARDAAVGRFFGRVARRIGVAFRSLLTMPRRMAVYDELAALSDRELADIGMTRSDIRFVFDEAFATRAERSHAVRPIAANINEVTDRTRMVEAA